MGLALPAIGRYSALAVLRPTWRSDLLRSDLLRGKFEELFGVAQGFRRHTFARQHAADFAAALLGRKLFDRGNRAAFDGVLFDGVVMVGEAGDLGEMGDAQYLIRLRELLQSASYGFRRAAANAGVDFVEYESLGCTVVRQTTGCGRGLGSTGLERQSDTRKLAAGCDPVERLGFFADIGRE